MPTKKKTITSDEQARSEYFSTIGKKGGKAALKKLGKDHFRKAAQKRWDLEREKKAEAEKAQRPAKRRSAKKD